MINRTVLVGRLTRDPEMKTTNNGTAVAQFTLAVNRQFTNAQGEREADFVNCVIWRKGAEALAQYTHKGSLIGVDGRIQTRTYEDKDGKTVFVTEVVADSFSFMESKKDNQPSIKQTAQAYVKQAVDKAKPASQDPFAGSGDSIDIDDSDLPF